MPPQRFDARGKSFVPLEDKVDGTHHAYRVQNLARVPTYDYPHGVPHVPTSPPRAPWANGTLASMPQADVSNVEFLQSIHLLTQLVSS